MDVTTLSHEACKIRDSHLGPYVLSRAVIEFSNVCHHNCAYCAMRWKNKTLVRYSLTEDQIRTAAVRAVEDGIDVIMLQAADNLAYDMQMLCSVTNFMVSELKVRVLLCIGDRPISHYKQLLSAGASQAIVKFETSNPTLYRLMRPHSRLEERLELIEQLDEMGYSVSSGFIQGLPGTEANDYKRDIDLTLGLPIFAASVSPFIPNDNTPLQDAKMPDLASVLKTVARLRIGNPDLLIPSVSAMNVLPSAEDIEGPGQLQGLLAGANVLTINYTPPFARELYQIYRSDRCLVERQFAEAIVAQARLQFRRSSEFPVLERNLVAAVSAAK